MEMTRKDLKRFVESTIRFGSKVFVGYCCYQDHGVSKYDLNEIGYNHGVYGWNWTLYSDPKTGDLYISCYRNVPNYIYELATR